LTDAGCAVNNRYHDIRTKGIDMNKPRAPVVVEWAPGRRDAGSFIGMFGTGQAAAARLGVLDAIGNRTDPAAVTYDVLVYDEVGRDPQGLAESRDRRLILKLTHLMSR
jgi:hypothetical protein